MLVLGINTSTSIGSFAIYDSKKGVIAEITTNLRRTHSETAMKTIDSLFNLSGIKKIEIDKIVVSIGPGSFTGIRIGIAIAKGLALALNKKITGVNELEILANNYSGDKKIVSLIDARKERVFHGVYKKNDGHIREVQKNSVGELQELLNSLEKNEQFVFIGDGAIIYKDLIKNQLKERAIFIEQSLNYPRASLMIELALEKEDNIFSLEPHYISKSQAERERESKS